MTRLLAILALLLFLAAPAGAGESSTPPPSGDKVAADAALDQKMMEDKALIAWVASAASDTMTFGNKNFQQRFLQSSPHFTKAGWTTFSAVLKNTGTFDDMLHKHQTLTAQAESLPVIKEQGAVDGKYRWIVAFPLAVHYTSSNDEEGDKVMQLNLVVERVPLADSPDGVQISQWVAQ